MRALAWMFTIIAFFGGLGLYVDSAFVHADLIGMTLIAASALLCPMLWSGDGAVLGLLGLSGRQRLAGCLALAIAVPVVVFFP